MAFRRLTTSIMLRNIQYISSAHTKTATPPGHHFSYQQCRRFLTSPKEPGLDDDTRSEQPTRLAGFFSRLLQLDGRGESSILRMLGYYSIESKAIGAANLIYGQIRQRANAALCAEFKDADRSAFIPQYEMLALHVYITLHRLRFEKGSVFENDATIAMQTLFENFWADVQARMMIEEHKLTLTQSGKWIKQCEKNFFAMALSFDEVWDDDAKMRERITKHITSLNADPKNSRRFLQYMRRERARLDEVSIEQMWNGECWDSNYPIPTR